MVKILLVEDNEMNRDMLSRRLAKRGYEVRSTDTSAWQWPGASLRSSSS